MSVEDCIFDPVLLNVVNVRIDLWRRKDYASDSLVLKLASLQTVHKLCILVGVGEDPVILVVCAFIHIL